MYTFKPNNYNNFHTNQLSTRQMIKHEHICNNMPIQSQLILQIHACRLVFGKLQVGKAVKDIMHMYDVRKPNFIKSTLDCFYIGRTFKISHTFVGIATTFLVN